MLRHDADDGDHHARMCHYHQGRRHPLLGSIDDAENAAMTVIMTLLMQKMSR